MIVNLIPTGWECIYQQAHALLAAELGSHWRPELRHVPPARWWETLAAIAQHDDGQDPWTGANGITEAGAPAPFKLVPFSLEQARRVTSQARFQGRWRWLLTSMHMSFLYEELRGQDPKTDAFLDEQRQVQETCRKELKLTKKVVQAGYDLVQWCDRLSLILCLNELPDAGRALEISRGPDGQVYQVRCAGENVIVEPWPFEPEAFEVRVEATYLTRLHYTDDEDLATALRAGEVREKVWRLINK